MPKAPKWKPPQKCTCNTTQIVEQLERIATASWKLACCCEKRSGDGHTNIHVVAVNPDKEIFMPPVIDHMPDFTLPSSALRAVLAVVGAKKADGTYATGGAWSTSDEAALPLEAIADDVVKGEDGTPTLDEAGLQIPVYKTFANTPLEPAAGEKAGGVVTWKAAGMADVDIKVVYGDPALGHAAITAGEAPEA